LALRVAKGLRKHRHKRAVTPGGMGWGKGLR
jgi:hypothetical protein